jgi:hypothetical protein
MATGFIVTILHTSPLLSGTVVAKALRIKYMYIGYAFATKV